MPHGRWVLHLKLESKLSRHGLVFGALSEKRPKLFWVLFGPLFLLGPLGSSCYGACGKASFPLFFAAIDKFLTLIQFSRFY